MFKATNFKNILEREIKFVKREFHYKWTRLYISKVVTLIGFLYSIKYGGGGQGFGVEHHFQQFLKVALQYTKYHYYKNKKIFHLIKCYLCF